MDANRRFGVGSKPVNPTSTRRKSVPFPLLTVDILKREAIIFARIESAYDESSLFGVTDGKAVGTYIEHKFRAHVASRYTVQDGNSAKGIDFPDLNVDIKVTSERQPQSSCPFKSARQKIFGLGYSLLVLYITRQTTRFDAHPDQPLDDPFL